MIPLVVKYAITAFIVVLVSEIAKSSGRLGAFIASLPLVTLLVMTWLHVEQEESAKIAEYAYLTFWYVLPTLPMFLVTPWLIERGHGFWVAVAAGLAITAVAFALTAVVARRIGGISIIG